MMVVPLHDGRTIYPHFCVDSYEGDTCTILPVSVGLAPLYYSI